jgi:N-acetylmuramoyl-L-alanine amidase/Fibronectin type III domain
MPNARTYAPLGVVPLVFAAATAVASPGVFPGEWTREVEATGIAPGDPPFKPVPPRRYETAGPQRLPLVRRVLDRGSADSGPQLLSGSLSGKSVYLSPGHGWTYKDSTSWYTQRPNTHGLVEDFSNADGIDQFLVPYLLAAGAQVVPVREIDHTPEMVILDDSDGTNFPARGRYQQSGAKGAFSLSTIKGWGQPPLPLTGSVNPFALGFNKLMQGSKQETARATFVPKVPRSGYYNVYIAYSMHSARASDARVRVAHPGGTTTFLVDQRRHGGTWVLLGRFYFNAGTDDKTGAVIVTNQTDDAGANVSADAIRIGGGMGLTDRGGGSSKQRRSDENSRYHAQFSGAPSSVYNASSGNDGSDDISSRSRFAAWVHAPGEPAVYISHHTNAFNGTARGTISFVYGKNPVDGKYEPTPKTLALGSDKLANAVHSELMADVHADWDPKWQDRKVKSAYFGELNTANQDEMPSMLLETAFHDNKDDAAALKEADFRRLVARAIYKGIVKYFATKDGNQPDLLPEPPVGLVARNSASGQVTISWQQPPSGGIYGDPAMSYRVFRSAGGYAFGNGADTGSKMSWTIKGLKPGQVIYLRVRATNDGGWSLPSPTLAVGISAGGQAPLLLVTGHDRFDPAMNLKLTYPKVNTADRLWPEQINDATYLVPHGRALAPSRIPFDSATHDAVDKGRVTPGSYELVLWQGGRGLHNNRALTTAGRAALHKAAQAGTSLILSGTVLARWLGGAGASPEDKTFLAQILHATAEAPGQHTQVHPSSPGPLEGLQTWGLTDHESGPYDGRDTDVVAAAAGGKLAASYTPGGPGAVVQYSAGAGKPCSVLMGFALETVTPPARQAEILSQLFKLCELKAPPAPDGGWPAASGADGGAGDGASTGDGTPDPGDDGCGCQLTSPRRGGAGLLLIAALMFVLRRRGRSGAAE